ncbi:MAG TPA: PRC-barrel domain-containing protein [Arthrobacter sp.]|nr:PRC-barrel domain-containing protein [Arthrobacter sp.]
MPNETDTLVKLKDTDETVVSGDEDIRGRSVKDRAGEDLGKVDDLLIDSKENKVRFLIVASGGFLGLGESKSFIPVDAVKHVLDDQVRIDQTREHVAGAPAYDPELETDQGYYENVYGYYGYAPFWGAGYVYPGYPYYGV